jgi:hypothetical protein
MKIYHFIQLAIVFICCTAISPKHDYHVSVTQMHYNPAQQLFEVSIRTFTDDLELGLSRDNNGRKFTLHNKDQNDAYVEKYVTKHFSLFSTKQKIKIDYLGKEQEADATWIYLEIPFQGSLEGIKLQNSILTDTYSDQINMLNFKMNQLAKTILYKKEKLVQSLL